MRWLLTALTLLVATIGCSRGPSTSAAAAPAPAQQKLGIRPNGDTEIQPDLGKIQSEDLKKVFAYIDEHIDDHVVSLQKWIRQPSISNSGEGIPESAEMVKGFFEQLGCQESRVYDVGITEWGSPGNPVVYARCDEGAPRTVAIYWQYDTMPVTQPDAWKSPPFEARIVEQAPYKKVLIGRGATNSKGPEMAQFNALMAIKAVTGKLPVNIVFVAEGNTPLVKGFTDGLEPLSASETAQLKSAAAKTDMKVAAENLGVARFIADDPFTMLKMARYGVSLNLDGIWGGNMYAGGAGAILPNKITSKHNIRYVPKMNGLEIVKRVREQLDRNGYKDVELKIIGDVPWSKMTYDTDIARAMNQMYDQFNIPHGEKSDVPTILGGYWPSYLFSNQDVGQRVAPVSMPIGMGGAGHGGNAHAANEYVVLEGAGKVYGMAGAEKSHAAIFYNFAGKNGAAAAAPRQTE